LQPIALRYISNFSICDDLSNKITCVIEKHISKLQPEKIIVVGKEEQRLFVN
jgi:hypothetical protein